jgi:predicted esterase
MQELAILMTLFTTLYLSAAANGWEKVKFTDSPSVIEPAVTYLSEEPAVDGKLDTSLQDLPIRRFTMVEKSASGNPVVALSYRLAYGAQFLYVFIEVEAERLTCRDRAYQNGDGFVLVLTHPAPGNAPTREFYVLACSAVDRTDMDWSRKVFWYYNVDHIFLPTSDSTKVAFHDGDGTISFELLLQWSDVHPYHPWLSDAIGFNLAMTKAVGEKDINSYRVVDAEIGSENSPREYALLQFEKPHHVGDPKTFVLLGRGHISEGDTLHGRAVTVASQAAVENLLVLTQTGEKAYIDYTLEGYECAPGLTFKDFVLKSYKHPAGGYIAKWESQVYSSKGESGFSVLPPFDMKALNHRLDGARRFLSPGSYTTLLFLTEEIEADLKELYPYETAAPQRIRIARVIKNIEQAEAGTDLLARQREFVRMAYRSGLDSTLQPYLVWIPKDFDPKKKYPLLVCLHGSGSTETDIVGWRDMFPEGFLALGPHGRGPSNWYCFDNAQTDIAEAIQSVKENFPVDERNIFLAGFSMGGYGVYRTFYEAPGTFRAIAIFSGPPKIDFQTQDKDVKIVDFTEDENIRLFKGEPVFIFHGKRDLNIPYDETERFVDKLKSAGVKVEFYTEDDKGHELPGDETISAFLKWVEAVLQGDAKTGK